MRISNGISALLALSYVAFVTPLAFAEEAGALKIDDLLAAREFDQLTVPALSPDEEWVIYTVHGGSAHTGTSADETTQGSIPCTRRVWISMR